MCKSAKASTENSLQCFYHGPLIRGHVSWHVKPEVPNIYMKRLELKVLALTRKLFTPHLKY